jgi:putative endonuclease
MKFQNRATGQLAENLALHHLQAQNYQLLAQNYSTKFGEIDLIMTDGHILVFVEVKAKKGFLLGTPEEMFTKSKYEKVKRMATIYLNGRDVPCRIDMIAVVLDQNNHPLSLRHYPNVYPL